MKIRSVLQIGSIKILLFLYERGEGRHTQLVKLVTSRATLSRSMKDLEDEGLIKRRLVDARPIQSYYSLTYKRRVVAEAFKKISGKLAD